VHIELSGTIESIG